jgi:hypothetical protein
VLGAGNGDPDGPDPHCADQPWKNKESGGCGIGFELGFVVVALSLLHRRRSH